MFLTICSFGQTKVISNDVNLRTSPIIQNNKICIIPKGTLVKITNSEENKNWSKVIYKGQIGYINNNYIKNSFTKYKADKGDNYEHSRVKHYKNSKGVKVQSPTYYDSPPEGATAECNDGTYSYSQSRRGTCSHHGGVKRWLR